VISYNRLAIYVNQKGVDGSEIPQTTILTKFSRIPNATIHRSSPGRERDLCRSLLGQLFYPSHSSFSYLRLNFE